MLTLSGKLFQVLQCDLFVPRAVCQTVIDHGVLKKHKHSLVTDTKLGKTRNILSYWEKVSSQVDAQIFA